MGGGFWDGGDLEKWMDGFERGSISCLGVKLNLKNARKSYI